MPDAPERPIEQLLRAAAKKRREDAGAPLELHPADRRLLQGEVARQLATTAREPQPSLPLLVRLWPRLAWSAAILAVLAAATALLLPGLSQRDHKTLLAGDERMAKALPAESPMPPHAVEPQGGQNTLVPQPEAELRYSKAKGAVVEQGAAAAVPAQTVTREVLNAQFAAPAAAPVAKAEASADKSVSPTEDRAVAVVTATGQPGALAAASRPSPSRAPAQEFALAPSGGLQSAKDTGVVQRYVQAVAGLPAQARFANKAQSAQPVLVDFQVEQSGRELRITDSDGSVYSGQMQVVLASRSARAPRIAAPAAGSASSAAGGSSESKVLARSASDQPAAPSYAFRVAGTNRTLGKPVVFTGNLLTDTSLVPSQQAETQSALAYGLAKARAESDQVGVTPPLNSRITGKVVVGNDKAIPVEAFPAQQP